MELVTEIKNILTIPECDSLVKYIDSIDFKNQRIFTSLTKSREIISMFRKNIPQSVIPLDKTFGEHITICKHNEAVKRHVDSDLGNYTHKLFIFLNQIRGGGGTYFNIGEDEPYFVPNLIGDGVLFDLSLSHWGQEFNKNQTKYTIGFRINLS